MPSLYHWFKEPIELYPREMTGKESLNTHFSKFQSIRPEVIADVIRGRAPKEIVQWFETKDFDESFVGSPSTLPPRKGKGTKGGNAPTSHDVEYWVYGSRKYQPLHRRLQEDYAAFLRKKSILAYEDVEFVDMRYVEDGCPVFVEVKPTEIIPPRFAIRLAAGQLLEHRYRLNQAALLEIVVGNQPEPFSVEFAKSLGIRLICKDGSSFVRLA